MPLLSVIVPVYNEAHTIKTILEKINAVGIEKEIIVIDDYSSDETVLILNDIHMNNLKVLKHDRNKGKGAAFLTGLKKATGKFVIIQDADLEYDPAEYPKLIKPLLEEEADVVLGNRFVKGYHGLWSHRLGNKFLTSSINLLFRSRLSDYATCYKLARKETFLGFSLESSSFDLEAEIVCKALKSHVRIVEVPIAYFPRSFAEGKKIKWIDGVHAVFKILKYRFT